MAAVYITCFVKVCVCVHTSIHSVLYNSNYQQLLDSVTKVKKKIKKIQQYTMHSITSGLGRCFDMRGLQGHVFCGLKVFM